MEKYTVRQLMKDSAMSFYHKANKYDKSVLTPLLLQALLNEAVNDTLTMSAANMISTNLEEFEQRGKPECI